MTKYTKIIIYKKFEILIREVICFSRDTSLFYNIVLNKKIKIQLNFY
jgi:hypothetical protein